MKSANSIFKNATIAFFVLLVAGAIVLFGAVLVGTAIELRRMNRYIKDDLPPIDYGQ